jgi:hypothetical protein
MFDSRFESNRIVRHVRNSTLRPVYVYSKEGVFIFEEECATIRRDVFVSVPFLKTKQRKRDIINLYDNIINNFLITIFLLWTSFFVITYKSWITISSLKPPRLESLATQVICSSQRSHVLCFLWDGSKKTVRENSMMRTIEW